MIITDMRIITVYEHEPPTTVTDEKLLGTVDLLLYYAEEWGDFFKSKVFDSLRPLLKDGFMWILINEKKPTVNPGQKYS